MFRRLGPWPQNDAITWYRFRMRGCRCDRLDRLTTMVQSFATAQHTTEASHESVAIVALLSRISDLEGVVKGVGDESVAVASAGDGASTVRRHSPRR
jgi:hypothetical protein